MINVLYMSSLNSSQINMKNFYLKDTSKFNIDSAMSWPEYYKKLRDNKVDVILSGMIFSDIHESFGVFFEHWQKNYSHIPFIIYSSMADSIPDNFYKIKNLYIVHNNDELPPDTLPSLVESLLQLRGVADNLALYKDTSLRNNSNEHQFHEFYFKEKTEQKQRELKEKRDREREDEATRQEKENNRPIFEKWIDSLKVLISN